MHISAKASVSDRGNVHIEFEFVQNRRDAHTQKASQKQRSQNTRERIIPAARSFFQMIAIQPTINAQQGPLKKRVSIHVSTSRNTSRLGRDHGA